MHCDCLHHSHIAIRSKLGEHEASPPNSLTHKGKLNKIENPPKNVKVLGGDHQWKLLDIGSAENVITPKTTTNLVGSFMLQLLYFWVYLRKELWSITSMVEVDLLEPYK